MADVNPTQAEVDAVAKQLLATVEEPRRNPLHGLTGRIFVRPETSFGLSADSVARARRELLDIHNRDQALSTFRQHMQLLNWLRRRRAGRQ